jgi:OOP family OmpA-OmpF porin
MRKTLMTSVMAAASVALLTTSTARADGPDLTLKVEPGVAFPLTSPQTDRFKVGGDLSVKPLVALTSWLAVGPSVSVLALPSSVDGVDTGTAWRFGGSAEVRRPHDNPSTGLATVSPWFAGELQYVRTGPLDRVAPSLSAGAAFPTSEARTLWVGPFVKYLDVVQSLADRPGFDNGDAHVLIAGVSLELGAATKKHASKPVPPPVPPSDVKKEEPKKDPPKKDPPPSDPVVIEIVGTVQFPWDSAVPLPDSGPVLEAALKALSAHVDWTVELQGHASSEGQVKHNDKLSVRRAQTVADYLTQHGVSKDRLTVKGFGSRVPVADNASEAGRVRNRRVEFKVDVVLKKDRGTK